MDDPNLQNVPHPVEYEAAPSETPPDDPCGSRPNARYQFNIRAAFRARQGWIMLSADYCQLEFRLMAHFSQDGGLCKMFNDSRNDPFKLLAADWLNASLDTVSVNSVLFHLLHFLFVVRFHLEMTRVFGGEISECCGIRCERPQKIT